MTNNGREKLLLQMYDQMFNDINRHIMVIWESIGVIIGAFAVFALVEKQVLPVDVASSIMVILCAWLLAHLYDASYWYNRNLVIIANIERQFLKKEDLKDIHYYFGKHRPRNVMLTHLQIQYALGLALAVLILLYHFVTRIVPIFSEPCKNFELLRLLPYVFTIIAIVRLMIFRKNRNRSYAEFIKNSPGTKVEINGIEYGIGHGFSKKDQSK